MSDRAADLAFVNAAAHTVDPRRPKAQALSIRDGLIHAVGSFDDVATTIGTATDVVDLEGRTLLPGFQDAHNHPPVGGLDRMRCNLESAATPDETLALVAAYAADRRDEMWIRGGAWTFSAFRGELPTAQQLDVATGDRPAYLTEAGSHGAWVNSAALRLAGIDHSTADPPDGRIERDARGEPTGILHEGAAALVEKYAPQPSFDDTVSALLLAQQHFLSLGITAWQDASVGEPQWGDSLEPYHSLAGDGRLVGRVVGSLWWWYQRGDEQVDDLVEMRERSLGRFRAHTVKIMLDGIIEMRTASMIDPYSDGEGGRGIAFVATDTLTRIVTQLDALGFQVHFHAIGDRAIRDALDAVEVARAANGPADRRHHIAHCQVVHPQDLARFAELGVGATCQPLWGADEEGAPDLTLDALGPSRHPNQYPIGSLQAAGAQIAFGSDWNVTTADPLPQLEVAVTRVSPQSRHLPPFGPKQRLSLDEAVRAFTMGSAYVNHLDDVTGSLSRGKCADLCVLDRDIFDAGAGPVGDASNVMTIVDGQVRFDELRR